MSVRKKLQEMEVGTVQSKTAVNKGAQSGDPMQHLTTGIPDGQEGAAKGNWEDLGGPTPQNYKPDDDSAKLKEPSLNKVSNVVNKDAKGSEPMEKMKKPVKEEEEFTDEDLLDEESGYEDEEDDDEDDEDDKKKKSKKDDEDDDEDDEVNEEVTLDLEDFNIDEDMSAILSSDETVELSENFKERTKTIFEVALKTKAGQINEFYKSHYENQIVEEVQIIKEELTERVDAYLEYVAEQWMENNELAINQGLETKLVESFLRGFKNLCEEHYVHIPEEKYDVLYMMKEKLDDMENKLDEQIAVNMIQKQRVEELTANGIFEEVTEDLADSQRDKLSKLAENVEFKSEEEYREKLESLKEAYTTSRTSKQQTTTTQTLTENTDPLAFNESMNSTMQKALEFL